MALLAAFRPPDRLMQGMFHGDAFFAVLVIVGGPYDLFQRVVDVLARGCCVLLRSVGKVYVGAGSGSLTDISELRDEHPQGMAILQVVGDDPLLESVILGCLPFKSPNDALQTGGI